MSKQKYFPIDCDRCEHFNRYDMSISDWTNKCTLYGLEHDDCDVLRLKRCPKFFKVKAKESLTMGQHHWVAGSKYEVEDITGAFTITSEVGWTAFTNNVKEDVLDLFEII